MYFVFSQNMVVRN